MLTPEQIKPVKPVHPGELNFMMTPIIKQDTEVFIHELPKVSNTEMDSDANRNWFPTPKNLGDQSKYTLIQSPIYNGLIEVRKLESFNPKPDKESRKQLLANFDWFDATLILEEQRNIEKILVEDNGNFARHRFDLY